jgi:hypothetical protein
MKLRLESDNWDYGTVGEVVSIDNRGLFTVGDVYKLHIWAFDNKQIETDCMVVNKQDEYKEGIRIPFFMGAGELWDYDKVLDKVSNYSEFNLGDTCGSLVFKEN